MESWSRNAILTNGFWKEMLLDTDPENLRLENGQIVTASESRIMKRSIPSLLVCLSLMFTAAYGQVTQTFDIATFQPPTGWKKQPGQLSVQFSTEDSAGAFCLITLYKSLPGLGDSKENFAAAWQTVVKEAVAVSNAPQMQPSNPADWTIEMGSAPFEKDGAKGVVVLVTVSGYGKMKSAMIITNTRAYESQITRFLESFTFSKPVSAAVNGGVPNSAPVRNGDGYAFTTSNFDDGWNAAIKSDWVEVTKGDTKVLLHYGITITDEMRRDLSNSYWNQIAANKYLIKNLYPTNYSVLKDFPYYFVQADATEKATGKNVFVSFQVIPKNGTAYCYEVVTPTKSSFSQQFPTMDKIENLSGYNRFAIVDSDLIGTWQAGAGAFTQYYFVSSGNYAGMNITVSNLKYIFVNGTSYRTEVKAVTNSIYASEKEIGKYAVGNWEISTTDQNRKLSSFSAWFEATKGGRILHLLNKQYSSEHYQLAKDK